MATGNRSTDTRLNLVEKVLQLKENNSGNNNVIKANTFEIGQHNDVIKQLQKDLEKLLIELDEQTDRNMREALVIHGVGGAEKSWEETTDVICSHLTEISNGELSYSSLYNTIVRAHRGGKDNKAIFVKFNNSFTVDQVKKLRTARGVYINQLHSRMINERLKKGRNLRKELKQQEGKLWKMYLNDNVQLMIKKPGDTKYSFYKQF